MIPILAVMIPREGLHTVHVMIRIPIRLLQETGMATNQFAFIKYQSYLIQRNLAIVAGTILIEVVLLLTNGDPARNENAFLGIAVYTLALEEAGKLSLTNVNTGFAEIIVELTDLVDTDITLAILIVGITAIFINPPRLRTFGQSVFIGERLIDVSKVTTTFLRAADDNIRIHEGIQIKCLLILRLLSKAVQGICAQVDVIADLTGVDHIQAILGIPSSIVLGSQLDATEDTNGVRGVRVNSLGLVLPSQGEGQFVRLLVELSLFQDEIIAEDGQPRIINDQILIKTDHGLNFRQGTDAFGQLEQEGPCTVVAFHIRTGQHVNKFSQLFGHGNLSHVNTERIGSDHIFFRIHHIVGDIIHRSRIGNLTVPSQHAVTASGIFEVERGLILPVQVDVDRSASSCGVIHQPCSNLHALDSRSLSANKGPAIHGTGSIVV